MIIILSVLLAFASTTFAQTPLTPTETKIVQTVNAENPQALDLIRQLVEINSGTRNLEGVRAVGKVLIPQFEALGFHVRWVPMDEVQRAGTLVAEHLCPAGTGKCGKRMLLIGHMDTVFEKDSPFQHYSVNGTTGTGPGASDMKGGLVVMLYALKAMQAAGALENSEITAVLSGDEESAGRPVAIARRDMIEAAKHSDVALEFEGQAREHGTYFGSTSRRGSIEWHLEATGSTGHSAGIFSPSVGYGAIYEIARILDTFRTQVPEPNLTFSVGLVVGGTTAQLNPDGTSGTVTGKDNIIPPIAYANGDIRALSNDQAARVEQKMQAIVAQHLPRTNATIKFDEGYPSMAPTAGNRALLGMLNQVNRSLGKPEMPELDPMKRGAGDVSFVAQYVDALAGVGASGSGAHAAGETIDLSAQPLNTKRAALLMYLLTQVDAGKNLTDLSAPK
ncbi:MAG: M20/M25/M40 family metallo-hydrolase [Acidobacteriaceae bacterium]